MTDDDVVLLSELEVFHAIGQQSREQLLDPFVNGVFLLVKDDVTLADLGQGQRHSWHIGKTMQLKGREIARNHTGVNTSARSLTYLSISP